MPHAYVTDSDAKIHITSERLRISKDDVVLADWKIAHLESLTLIGTVSITMHALHGLLEAGVEVSLLSTSGRYLGRVTTPLAGGIRYRLAQYRIHQDPVKRLSLAKAIVIEKVEAMMELLRRYGDNYADAETLSIRRWLADQLPRVRQAKGLDELRGVEGTSAARYWRAFGRLNRSRLDFSGRSTRPPRDAVNSLLGASYSLLVKEFVSACHGQGLDPYLGFYHEPRNERPSLALDLMEPYRHRVVDRLVLRLANRKMFGHSDFEETDEGAIWLKREAWRRLLAEWDALMMTVDEAGSGPKPGWRDRIRDAVLCHRKMCLEDVEEPITMESAFPEDLPPVFRGGLSHGLDLRGDCVRYPG